MAKRERKFSSHDGATAPSASEEHYRSLFEDSPISLWEEDLSDVKAYLDDLRRRGIKDLEGVFAENPEELTKCVAMIKVVNINKATLLLYKAGNKEEFLAKWPTVFTPESHRAFQAALLVFFEGGMEFATETVNRTLTGERLNIILKLSVVPGHKANLARVLASRIDITELKQSQQQTEGILRAAFDGFWVVDSQGRFVDVNDAYCRLIGYNRDELLKMHIQDVEAAETPEETAQHIRHIKEVGADRFETRHRRKDGEILEIEVSTNYVDIAGGKFIVFLRDNTERKRAIELSEALNDINMTITSSFKVDEILQRAIVVARRAIGSEAAGVILHENDFWVAKYLQGFPPELDGSRFAGEEVKHLDLAAQTRRPLIVNDTYSDDRVDRALMERIGVRSFLAVPLSIRGEVFGVLAFHYRSAPRVFSDAQIDFAVKLAVSVSLAVEHAESYDTTQRALTDAQTLSRVAARVSQTLELEEVLEVALRELLTALDIGNGCIYIFDAGGQLVIRAQQGLGPTFLGRKSVIDAGEGCAGTAAATKRSFTPTQKERHFVCEESERLLGLDCLAAIPIVARGESLGVVELFAPVARRLSPRERAVTEAISNQLAAAAQNARLYADQRHIADTLQQALLTIPSGVNGLAFGHIYRSATAERAEVGGDFYDLFELEHHRVGLAIGDVSGKGLEAATLTSLVKNTIKAYAYQGDPPAEVIKKTNAVLCNITDGQFVTALFGIVDINKGIFTYCGAGHPPPVLKLAGGKAVALAAESPAIGVFRDLTFISQEQAIGKSEVLVVYTDGVIEARRGGELFGQERLLELVSALPPRTVEEMPEAILEALLEFSDGWLADDMAVMTLALSKQF